MRLLLPIPIMIKKNNKAVPQERTAESTLIFTDKVVLNIPHFDSVKAFKKLDDKIKKEEKFEV